MGQAIRPAKIVVSWGFYEAHLTPTNSFDPHYELFTELKTGDRKFSVEQWDDMYYTLGAMRDWFGMRFPSEEK